MEVYSKLQRNLSYVLSDNIMKYSYLFLEGFWMFLSVRQSAVCSVGGGHLWFVPQVSAQVEVKSQSGSSVLNSFTFMDLDVQQENNEESPHVFSCLLVCWRIESF